MRGGSGIRVPVFDHAESGGEDPGLNDLELGALGEGRVGGFVLGVESVEGAVEFAADGHPFGGFEVVVLEEEHQRGGA